MNIPMSPEAFRLKAAQLQKEHEAEVEDLRKAFSEDKIDLASFIRLNASAEDRHNTRVRNINLEMNDAASAPHYNK